MNAMPAPGIAEDIVRAVHRALVVAGFRADPQLGEDPIVPGPTADDMLVRASAQLRDDAIALAVATKIPIGSLGILDYAMCTSATMRDALSRVAKYYGVATQRVRVELATDVTNARLVFHRTGAHDANRHWSEFGTAIIATRIRQTLGAEVAFTHVAFAHAAPRDRRRHDAFFATPVVFDAENDELAFRSALLDRPLVTAQHAMAELLEQKMRELEPATSAGDPLVDRAYRALAGMLDNGATDVGELARRLGTSTRSLQRALGQRSTSHSAILDHLRRERASRMLDRGERVADIAKQLGFAAPSAFFRAYRRWTGTSPKANVRATART